MAYADYVLSKNPVTYLTMSGASGNLNITGRGINSTGLSGYTAGTFPQIVPGYECGTISDSSHVENLIGCLTEISRQKSYTLELWAKLKVNPFSGYYTTAYDIISTVDGNCKVYIENSFVTVMLTASDSTIYRASVKHSDFDQSMHIAVVYTPSQFYIAVNGVQSDLEVFPYDKTIKDLSGDLIVSSTNMFLSNLAIYSRELGINEIQSNYSVGKSKIDKASMVRQQGGSFYTLSKDSSSIKHSNKINYEDFSAGNNRNLIVSANKLKNFEYKSISIQDTETFDITPIYASTTGISIGSMSVTGVLKSITGGYRTILATGNSFTTGSTVILSGFSPTSFNEEVVISSVSGNELQYASTNSGTVTYTTGNIQCIAHASIPSVPGLASNGGFIGVRLIPNYSVKELLTIYSETSAKSLTWSLTGTTGLINLTSKIYDSYGDVVSTNTYNYASPVAAGLAMDFWVLIDSSGVRMSTTGNTFNQSSSSDYVYEAITINEKTQIILGADYQYRTTSTSTFPVSKIWVGSDIPSTVTLSDFKLTSSNNYMYDFSSSLDKSAKTRGEWTYTVSVPTEGTYTGNYIDYDISPDSLSKLQLKYDTDTSYSECRPGKFLPSMPYSGTLGATGVPITLQVVLETSNVEKNVPEFSNADIFIYEDNTLNGTDDLGDILITGSNASIRNEYFLPGENRKRLNTTFINNNYLKIPAPTGGSLAHQSVEFTFAYQGSPNNNSVICSSFNGSNNVYISNSGLVTVSGWPTTTSYLNGSSIGSGATAQTNSINHILIVGTTGTTAPLYLNASVTAGGATGYFSSTTGYSGATAGVQSSYGYLATWPVALTGATGGTGQTGQTKDSLDSRRGYISMQLNTTSEQVYIAHPTGPTGSANPEVMVNVTPWQSFSSG